MRRILKCCAGHTFLEDVNGPNQFGKPHIGCGETIRSSGSAIEDESKIYYCRICNAPETANYMEYMRIQMLERQLCFDCNFWQEKIDWRKSNNPKALVINGNHYMAEENVSKEERRFAGHGGQKFVIEANDGRRIETNNLWHQGEVPERFRNVLTDNATFVQQ